MLHTYQRGAASELAVFSRLIEKEFEIYAPLAPGSKFDCLVSKRGGTEFVRVQIRTASHDKRARNPWVRLRCSNGRGKQVRYKNGDYDVLIAWDHKTSSIYILREKELRRHKHQVSLQDTDLDRWDRVK